MTTGASPSRALAIRARGCLILGLAPAAHGANRTGRVFTGDGVGASGDFLMAALHRAGFANIATSRHPDDGLRLTDCYIAARCAARRRTTSRCRRDRRVRRPSRRRGRGTSAPAGRRRARPRSRGTPGSSHLARTGTGRASATRDSDTAPIARGHQHLQHPRHLRHTVGDPTAHPARLLPPSTQKHEHRQGDGGDV